MNGEALYRSLPDAHRERGRRGAGDTYKYEMLLVRPILDDRVVY